MVGERCWATGLMSDRVALMLTFALITIAVALGLVAVLTRKLVTTRKSAPCTPPCTASMASPRCAVAGRRFRRRGRPTSGRSPDPTGSRSATQGPTAGRQRSIRHRAVEPASRLCLRTAQESIEQPAPRAAPRSELGGGSQPLLLHDDRHRARRHGRAAYRRALSRHAGRHRRVAGMPPSSCSSPNSTPRGPVWTGRSAHTARQISPHFITTRSTPSRRSSTDRTGPVG